MCSRKYMKDFLKVKIILFVALAYLIFHMNMIFYDFKKEHHIHMNTSIEYVYFVYSLIQLCVCGILSFSIDV